MRTDYNLREITLQAFEEFLMVDDKDAAVKPAPNKWSAKEILGHLIDSASNNHGRFVRAQFSDDLIVTPYAQNDWVEAADYQNMDWQDLLITWRQMNILVSNIMYNTTPEVRDKQRTEHNLHKSAMEPIAEGEPTTLGHFMEDYVFHLKHHLGQIREVLNTEEA